MIAPIPAYTWRETPPVDSSLSPRARRTLGQLRAVVLLSGAPWPTPFASGIGRSLLDLPIEDDRNLVDHWRVEVENLARAIDAPEMTLWVQLCRHAPIPTARRGHARVRVRVERDRRDFRGTGGVLRDLAEPYGDDDYLLVVGGAQLMIEDLSAAAKGLANAGTDVVLVAQGDGLAGGLTLVRCGALRCVPSVGFVDFKEQALPTIARHHDVAVAMWGGIVSLPIRCAAEYLTALRVYHRKDGPPADATLHPLDGGCPGVFAIKEAGAEVHPSAIVIDSVVLRGSRVEAKAAAIRSVVCARACVGTDRIVRDQFVLGGPAHGDHWHGLRTRVAAPVPAHEARPAAPRAVN
jgi:hypothetical protein